LWHPEEKKKKKKTKRKKESWKINLLHGYLELTGIFLIHSLSFGPFIQKDYKLACKRQPKTFTLENPFDLWIKSCTKRTILKLKSSIKHVKVRKFLFFPADILKKKKKKRKKKGKEKY
jgi:hypothetical protein